MSIHNCYTSYIIVTIYEYDSEGVHGIINQTVARLSGVFIGQRIAGDDMSPCKHFETRGSEEGRQGYHLHAPLSNGCGQYVGLCKDWSHTHCGICRIQLCCIGGEDPGW